MSFHYKSSNWKYRYWPIVGIVNVGIFFMYWDNLSQLEWSEKFDRCHMKVTQRVSKLRLSLHYVYGHQVVCFLKKKPQSMYSNTQ